MDKNVDIGRMGENIVTNELLSRHFLVTHLDKGTRGVSANADLLVGHARLERPVLIQVKACVATPSPDWIFLGSPSEKTLTCEEPMYNKKVGFNADYLATVSIAKPNLYRIFLMPISEAEKIALRTLQEWHAHPTRQGEQRKLIPKLYVYVDGKSRTRASQRSQEIFSRARADICLFEDLYDSLLTVNDFSKKLLPDAA